MHLTAANVFTIIAWAALACAAMWLITMPLRRRSLSGVLASVVLVATAASTGAVLGGVHVMVLRNHEQTTVLILAGTAGILGAIAAGAAARGITKDRRILTAAFAELRAGRVPSHDGRPLSADLEALRRELGATAENLAASRNRERALEDSRRELVAWVSHDLRTPLAGLRAMSEALEDGVVDDAELIYKQIRASVDRLSGMVDDLFDLSRIQAGSFARDVGSIALDDLLSDCVAALKPLADAQGVRLAGRTAGAAVVAGNGPELNRALTNLVANAIRHTPTGGQVEVCVGVVSSAEGAAAQVIVEDECGGIAEHDLPRIFEVGFRGEQARTPHAVQPAGAGLGLAITKGIIEAHAGSVQVANTKAGCRFTVRLPLVS